MAVYLSANRDYDIPAETEAVPIIGGSLLQNFIYTLKGETPFFHADKHLQVITLPTLILADAAQNDNDLLHMCECA